ncbi:hypothetical protein EVAR_5367_1 [Eumeta japonica]|uniref:Uncharacterized protein n=1 Tax=Eumeta variegata TaxID=151549 RepID=A0A4C1TMY3_EUMVA|nr:hypothetical protein EVAR_5367_1 [Eumeta japonica]
MCNERCPPCPSTSNKSAVGVWKEISSEKRDAYFYGFRFDDTWNSRILILWGFHKSRLRSKRVEGSTRAIRDKVTILAYGHLRNLESHMCGVGLSGKNRVSALRGDIELNARNWAGDLLCVGPLKMSTSVERVVLWTKLVISQLTFKNLVMITLMKEISSVRLPVHSWLQVAVAVIKWGELKDSIRQIETSPRDFFLYLPPYIFFHGNFKRRTSMHVVEGRCSPPYTYARIPEESKVCRLPVVGHGTSMPLMELQE